MNQTSHIHSSDSVPPTLPATAARPAILPDTDLSPAAAVTVAVIGGDERMTHLSVRLAEAGYTVNRLGGGSEALPGEARDGTIRLCTTVGRATEDAVAVVLPLPATRDGTTVWCPRDPTCTVTFESLAELMNRRPELLLFGGRLPRGFFPQCEADEGATIRSRISDYYDSETLRLHNAYITAEAALMTAMELTDCTLRGTSVAVIGYGRIGKLLARLLMAVGADVTVCARREEACLWAAQEGCHPMPMGVPDRTGGGLYPLCYGHTVIFNTVPARVLERDVLLRMEHGTLLIDLASAPFGVADEDVRDAAAENGLRYVRAPSLPGTYAPRDAGRAIAVCVLDSLHRAAKCPPAKAPIVPHDHTKGDTRS